MPALLFCYGTLMAPELMAAVIGRRARALPATLAGYRRATLRGRPYPGLWPAPAAQVDGCCYRLHHRRELARADRYEGSEYRRCRVTVATPEGPRTAWVYLPIRGRARSDGPWSARAFARRHRRHYLRRIAAWRSGAVAGTRPGDA